MLTPTSSSVAEPDLEGKRHALQYTSDSYYICKVYDLLVFYFPADWSLWPISLDAPYPGIDCLEKRVLITVIARV